MEANKSGVKPGALQIGIIGYGRFGRLVARILKTKVSGIEVLVFARRRTELGTSRGIRFATLDEVCRSDIVIPCVPISAFEEVIKSICAKIKPGTLLVDVSSVKVYPIEVMTKYIPANIEILATHPTFGPDSARQGLKGLKIVMHPVRVSPARFARTKQVCQDMGLRVIEMSPEEHDELMAYSLAYTHLIGRIGQKMDIKNTAIDTKGFAQLLKVQACVVNDTTQLFKDMQKFNPYAKEMRQQFQQALARIEKELSLD